MAEDKLQNCYVAVRDLNTTHNELLTLIFAYKLLKIDTVFLQIDSVS